MFHSRTDAFAEDEVLQKNVVFLATKATGWNKAKDTIALQFTVTWESQRTNWSDSAAHTLTRSLDKTRAAG